MNSSFRRHQVRCLCVALAAAAFAAPAAQAHHAPGEDPATTAPRQSLPGAASQRDSATQWNASPLEIDRLGPKHVPLQHPVSPPPATVVKVVSSIGFDWGDAGIGASVASLTLALVAALALLLTRRGRTTIAPERSELPGT
jgi:hypothetical protein